MLHSTCRNMCFSRGTTSEGHQNEHAPRACLCSVAHYHNKANWRADMFSCVQWTAQNITKRHKTTSERYPKSVPNMHVRPIHLLTRVRCNISSCFCMLVSLCHVFVPRPSRAWTCFVIHIAADTAPPAWHDRLERHPGVWDPGWQI